MADADCPARPNVRSAFRTPIARCRLAAEIEPTATAERMIVDAPATQPEYEECDAEDEDGDERNGEEHRQSLYRRAPVVSSPPQSGKRSRRRAARFAHKTRSALPYSR